MMSVNLRSGALVSLVLLGGAVLAVSQNAVAGDGCCGDAQACADDGDANPPKSAEDSEKTGDAARATGLLVDVGNTKCPIMGGKPDGKTWSEWNGLRIGHCCPMCIETFAKDPEKSLDAAKIDWRAAAEAVKRVSDAKPEEREKALAALKAKWTVVRESAAALAPPAVGELLVDLGNAKCPIMGHEPDGKTWTEWKGLRIGHCCPMCIAKLAKDPEKLLDAAKIEWRPAAEAVKKVNDAKPEEREKALVALKAKWRVVREPAVAPTVPTPAK